MFKAGKAWKPSEHIGAGVKAAANWATQQNEKSRREFLQKDLEKKIIKFLQETPSKLHKLEFAKASGS